MKILFTLLLSACSFGILVAQDLITFRNGTQVSGSVLELTPTLIKFKKVADGPTYSLNLSDVSSITYQNGTVETINPTPIVSIPTNTTNTNSNTKTKTKPDPVDDEMLVPTKRYGGPRVGLTYLSEGTTRTRIAHAFNRVDISPFVSQFGWQFETRIFTIENGASGLVEFVPLIGGLEQGLFLPSANILLGFRGANGIEVGVGPSASLAGFGIVMAAGASFKVGKITFPFNVAFSPNIKKQLEKYDSATGTWINENENSGFRLSFFIGFNSRKG
ncbi:MAG: hypothetical protein K9I97_01165 [Cryomorphaceae bacterium]|jgi:hypothetical protein|nr:hypothetical protein [Cryomorphaceae bacterium]